MSLAPWRSPLSHALDCNRSRPDARYIQLATVRPNGYPANRTVVFRGFRLNSDQLMIVTDNRSEKISQIQAQPWGEICWYFPDTREQFRLGGMLTLIGQDYTDQTFQQERIQVWKNLSDAARLQFAWPNPKESRTVNCDIRTLPPPDPHNPLDNFCLLLLTPKIVDHLELQGDPHNRCIYVLDDANNWSTQEVTP